MPFQRANSCQSRLCAMAMEYSVSPDRTRIVAPGAGRGIEDDFGGSVLSQRLKCVPVVLHPFKPSKITKPSPMSSNRRSARKLPNAAACVTVHRSPSA